MLKVCGGRSACPMWANPLVALAAPKVEANAAALVISQLQRFINVDLSTLEHACCCSWHKNGRGAVTPNAPAQARGTK